MWSEFYQVAFSMISISFFNFLLACSMNLVYVSNLQFLQVILYKSMA